MLYRIEAMTRCSAEEISHWTYEKEYAIYSFEPGMETLEELLNGDYYSCHDRDNHLVGYFCKGNSARIPTVEAFDYEDGELDIGLGMKPELCGKGLGYTFLDCGMEFMKTLYGNVKMRLSVASFNQRAIHLYRRHGFAVQTKVTHRNTLRQFLVMEKGSD